MCRSDTISLLYTPAGPGQTPENTPVRPYTIQARPWFSVGKLPHQRRTNEADRGFVWDAECVSAGRTATTSCFAAKDTCTAVQVALVLESAQNAVRSGALKSLPCPNVDTSKTSTCEAAILANGDRSKIDDIETCPFDIGTVCYIFDLASSIKLTIKAQIAADTLTPSGVTSIAIEQYIVVTLRQPDRSWALLT